MKKLFTLFFLFTAFLSHAQNNLDKITGLSSTTASVAYSLRQLSSNYSGPLVRIKVGTSFYDVYPDASTTKFSLSSKISAAISTYNVAVAAVSTNALNTIIAGSTDATVAIWYDQSGNGVHVLSNTSTAKIISAGSINTLYGQPTVYFSGTNGESLLTSANTVNYSSYSGATVNAVAQNGATTSSFAGIIGAAYAIGNPGYNIAYDATIGKGYASDGAGCTYGGTSSSTTPQIITNIFTNTTTNLSNTYINGVLKTPSSTSPCTLTHTSGSKIYIGSARGYGPASFIGNISEAIIFPSQLSDGVRNSLESNQSSVYFSPTVTISSSVLGAVCAGTSVTFTATTYNFTGTPTYQWYKNGAVISGETNATYTTSTLANADQIYVIASAVTSNSLNANITAGPSAVVSVSGDGCINKTTLSTPAGQTSYAWYKDNVAISNTNSNTYFPTTAGDYKVQVTSGSCSTMSAATTIAVCGVTADGRMRSIATPTTLVSQEGGVNFGTGVSEAGATVNATEIGTTLGTVGATTAVVSGVISATSARTTSIGVIYSTDSNFGTYSTSSTQSNVVSGAYAFSLSGLSATTNYYAKSFIENKAGRSYGPSVSFTTSSPPKAVGDLYGGGIIYYVLQSGDNGYDANVQHGLIAQQTNEAAYGNTWNVIALNGNTITAAQNDGTLVGRANTAAIIANQGTGTYLFKYVSTLSINGYTDWYVPSIREINLFRNYVYNTSYCNSNGAFPYYWSSIANPSYKWAWGNYVSSTQSGSVYYTNYIEGNGVGTRAYSQTQSDSNFIYLAIRSF